MRQSKIRVAMITGDSKETAETIAEELGFYEKGVDEALSGESSPHSRLVYSLLHEHGLIYDPSP